VDHKKETFYIFLYIVDRREELLFLSKSTKNNFLIDLVHQKKKDRVWVMGIKE
jgi:hypothetical protein